MGSRSSTIPYAIALLFSLLAYCSGLSIAEPSRRIMAERDGIAASLEVRSTGAVMRWRFTRPQSSTLSGSRGKFDERSGAVKSVAQSYPDANEQSLVVC